MIHALIVLLLLERRERWDPDPDPGVHLSLSFFKKGKVDLAQSADPWLSAHSSVLLSFRKDPCFFDTGLK
jgi:hypothetical protein